MNHSEKLMQAKRDAPRGSYGAGKAWVAYMKHARVRGRESCGRAFADMMRRHAKWPLSMSVATLTPVGYVHGRVNGHLNSDPNKCWVAWDNDQLIDMQDGRGPNSGAIIPFRNLKKINPK